MGKMRQLRRELRAAIGQPAAFNVWSGRGMSMRPALESVMRGERVSDADLYYAITDDDAEADERRAAAEKLAAPTVIPAGRGGKATALVSVRGVCLYETEYQPIAFSSLRLAQTITQLANDPEIGTIVLDIDSPGGVVTGVAEAADAIFAARQTTRVVALINWMACSAAYWIASQAQEIVAVPSSDTGCIGVFITHAECARMLEESGLKVTFIVSDASPYKVEGNPYEELSPEAFDYWKSEVNAWMSKFLAAVARGRGVDVAKVRADFGQGRSMMAEPARRAGLIDRIATINAAMQRWGVSLPAMEEGRYRRRGEDAGEPPATETAEDAVAASDVEDEDGASEADAADPAASPDPTEIAVDGAAVDDAFTAAKRRARRRRLSVLRR